MHPRHSGKLRLLWYVQYHFKRKNNRFSFGINFQHKIVCARRYEGQIRKAYRVDAKAWLHESDLPHPLHQSAASLQMLDAESRPDHLWSVGFEILKKRQRRQNKRQLGHGDVRRINAN